MEQLPFFHTNNQVMIFHNLTGFYSAKNIEDLIAESERMKRFKHQNVMGLIGVSIDVGERPFIVMPFMANGSLLTYLKKNRSRFTEKMVIKSASYIATVITLSLL